jgi:CHASE3 domain sensor protein
MAPEKKAWLGFLAGALLLLLVGASGWWCAARFLGDFQRVEHTNQVRDLVQSLLTDILEMRSTTRDFAVTGSEAVRAVYLADDARLGDSLRRLRVLTADDPAQQQRLDQLDPLVTEIRRILAERVAAKQERNVDLSRDPGHFLQGQRVIDRIRAVVEAMAADETGRLHRRLASAQTVARANLATAAGVGVLAAGLVVGAGWIARRNFWLRQRTEASLRASERRYRTLFNSLDEGFAVFEMIFDAQGHAVDYRFLEVSPSFEKQTGLRDAVGRRMRELAPGHEAHWFETYGRIALTGEPLRFQNRAE